MKSLKNAFFHYFLFVQLFVHKLSFLLTCEVKDFKLVAIRIFNVRASCCVFKEISLVASNQRNYFENANASWKRVLQLGFGEHSVGLLPHAIHKPHCIAFLKEFTLFIPKFSCHHHNHILNLKVNALLMNLGRSQGNYI